MPDQTKVTVNIRDDVLSEIKQLADDENKTVTEVINEALRLRAMGRDHDLLVQEQDVTTNKLLF